mmetsp:Transcript_983/g.1926  ORF Transcript_983/g.1926 Transcript_983/m.1926 type:complete len:398 (+) Transcript_983:481-1674(+)|eukprot:CAMPEP_0184507982 /NCGR_PEP_ID=MMETSP0198_2-20121128/521_1 /TAXON_ID=1112570 /ORGANISM="Thraustochytrium sp., Strain LLF1b" /LENGTH=397 /DNA_ID=CAMNT_0026897743 /DNA_START=466 /DNA_END=1659 /DNA_ORIENTATION=+
MWPSQPHGNDAAVPLLQRSSLRGSQSVQQPGRLQLDRRSSMFERRVTFAQRTNYLEDWEDPHVLDTADVSVEVNLGDRRGILSPNSSESSGSSRRARLSSSVSLSPGGPGAPHIMPHNLLQRLGMLFVVGVFCTTGLQLMQMGFFNPNTGSDLLPILANGTAVDRETGAKFLIQTTPPNLAGTFDLFGLNPHTGGCANLQNTENANKTTMLGLERQGHEQPSSSSGEWPTHVEPLNVGEDQQGYDFVLGLYVENRTEDIAKLRQLAADRNVATVTHAIMSSGYSLGLRIVLVTPSAGKDLAECWAHSLEQFLRRANPDNETAVAEDLTTFQSWFPEVANVEDVIWFTWDGSSRTTVTLGDNVGRSAEDKSSLGRALFESELATHGQNLLRLFFHFSW